MLVKRVVEAPPHDSFGPGANGLAAFDGDTGIPSSYGTSGPGPGRYFAAGGGGGRNATATGPFPGGIGGGGAGGVETPGTGRHGSKCHHQYWIWWRWMRIGHLPWN